MAGGIERDAKAGRRHAHGRIKSAWLASALSLMLLGLTTGARADGHGDAPHTDVHAAEAPELADDPKARSANEGSALYEPWHYNTDYYFGLTRGLPESGAPERTHPYWMVLTIPMDVITLPGAALAGLFG